MNVTMDSTVPYQQGFLLGRAVDAKSMKLGYMLVKDDITPTHLQVNMKTFQFSFIQNLKDVCDILSIPLEYALKVNAQIIHNEAVSKVLQCIGKKNTASIVFRASFLKEKQYLPSNAVPTQQIRSPPKQTKSGMDEQSLSSLEGKLVGAANSLDSDILNTSANEINKGDDSVQEQSQGVEEEPVSSASDASLASNLNTSSLLSGTTISMAQKGTHWVKAVEIGSELITILSITSADDEKRTKLHYKICECLKAYRGLIDEEKIKALQKVANDIDSKLVKKSYKDTKLEITYCTYQELKKYPAEFSGMLKAFENFMDQSVGWVERSKQRLPFEIETRPVLCKPGVDKDEKPSMTDAFLKKISNLAMSSDTPEVKYTARMDEAGDEEDNHDSFVVLEKEESRYLYHTRATLQSVEEPLNENFAELSTSLSSLAMSQYPEATYNMFEKLFHFSHFCREAADKLQDFTRSRWFVSEMRVAECNQVLKTIMGVHNTVYQLIADLDLVVIPPASSLEDILSVNPLDTVNLFIENVTSKLPPGTDLDLLMIGKTGHGKSCTGNSILGQNRFLSSSDSNSVTSKTGVGWAETDGRTIKVVDTPGVCDTHTESDEDSVDLAIRSISEAIASSPNGFHALLLIIRFGIRMTSEEKKAIALLKCVMGEDIIRNHTICVITYGDNFATEMAESKTTFEEWCHKQSGFLKEMFQECNYRCVLFNNKAKNPRDKKRQLIQLIDKVDTLKCRGTRYTNSIFEYALRERNRIVSEEQVPQVNEDMMRDIQLILEYLNTMVNNTDEHDKYKEELTTLKNKVDNLSNHLAEGDSGQMGYLVDTVFALAQNIHAKMDEIADRPKTDSPDEAASRPQPETADEGAAAVLPTSSTTVAVNNNEVHEWGKDLQNFYDDNVTPKNQEVTDKTAKKVAEKVKKEKECFPGSSRVTLSSGKSVRLDELRVGDSVLTQDPSGQLVYGTVYMFGHKENGVRAEFCVLKTQSQRVSITEGHYIYCNKNNQPGCVRAGDIRVGDGLYVVDSCGVVTVEAVEDIVYEEDEGLYAPFVDTGKVVIDGVLVSCYIDVLPEKACHTLLWPVRQLYKLSPQMLARLNDVGSQNSVPGWALAVTKML